MFYCVEANYFDFDKIAWFDDINHPRPDTTSNFNCIFSLLLLLLLVLSKVRRLSIKAKSAKRNNWVIFILICAEVKAKGKIVPLQVTTANWYYGTTVPDFYIGTGCAIYPTASPLSFLLSWTTEFYFYIRMEVFTIAVTKILLLIQGK